MLRTPWLGFFRAFSYNLSRWFTQKYYNTNLQGVIAKKIPKYTFVLTTLKKCIFFTLYEHGEIPWDQGIVCK